MMPHPKNKADALHLITDLVDQFSISLDEIGGCIVKESRAQKSGKWIPRVLGYLGAIFIFGGLALYISMEWGNLSSSSRVIITYGPGIAALILGVITLSDERFIRASTPLFLKSAVLQPVGMFVYLNEYAEGNDAQLGALIVFGIVAVQFLATFLFYKRTSLLFFGYLFWNSAVGILMDRAGVPGDILGITLGLSIMMTAWSMDRTLHRSIAPFWYFLGSTGLLWSIFDVVERTPLDMSFLAVATAMMFLSVRMQSRTLLIVSTGALLGYLGYFTEEHFRDVIGWPISLMFMGSVMIGISYWAVQMSRRIKVV